MEAGDDFIGILSRVREPGVGIGRKIGIVAENFFGCFMGFELYEKAMFADKCVQGKVDFRFLELCAV